MSKLYCPIVEKHYGLDDESSYYFCDKPCFQVVAEDHCIQKQIVDELVKMNVPVSEAVKISEEYIKYRPTTIKEIVNELYEEWKG